MNGHLRHVAWYRFRTTLGRRWGGYVTLALLVGLIGGVAVAAIAGARRTQSSFPAYFASTNPADLGVFTAFAGITPTGHSPQTDAAIAKVPGVERVVRVIGFDPTLTFLSSVQLHPAPGEAPPAVEGSPDGEYATTDRLTVRRGRLLNPARIDEIEMTSGAAAEAGMTIGSKMTIVFYTLDQVVSPSYQGYPHDKPYLTVTFTLVGIVTSSSQVVEDDADALGNQLAVISPTLTRKLMDCCAGYTYVTLKLAGGARDIASVEAAINKLPGEATLSTTISGQRTSKPLIAKAERSIRPEAIAFGVFGCIVAIAALVIGGLSVSRLVRDNARDAGVLRALGSTPRMTSTDALLGVLIAIGVGAALAVVIAVALSPLAPFGAVRSVYPHRGIAADWTVIAAGCGLLVVVLCLLAAIIAHRQSPHRLGRLEPVVRPSRVIRSATNAGLSPGVVSGLAAALGSDRRRQAPVRCALIGGVLAVVVVVTSFTFGASLTALVSKPALYGWNWDYTVLAAFSGQEDMPAKITADALDNDHDVAAWTGITFTQMRLDGRRVSALATSLDPKVAPPLLSGHGLKSADEVVLGPATLAALHKRVGDKVSALTGPGEKSVQLRIAGTATMPTIGHSGEQLQMGSGAIVSTTLFSTDQLNPQGNSIAGPQAVLVRIRPGVSAAAGRASLDAVVASINKQDDEGPAGGVVSVLRPAEIANYKTIGSTPAVLAGILAAGAVAAFGLTLLASVRGRRRELAILKTFGFTKRQVRSSVACQASASGVVAVGLGVPVGIALGRQLWDAFAEAISAVPAPSVPASMIVLVTVGALLFANVVALLPARLAARTPSGLMLRGE